MAGKSKLVQAVQARSVPHLLCLLKEEDHSQESMDEALHLAALQGQAVCVRMLLAIGADTSSISKFGHTVLLEAIQSGNTDTVNVILDEGYDVNYKVGDVAEAETFVPLHLAISSENAMDVVPLLLDRGAKTNTLDRDGDTPLIAACNEQRLDLVKLLLSRKVDVNLPGYEGGTALHRAAQIGDKDMIKTLLEYNASPLFENTRGNTPLLEACCCGNKDVIELLLRVCGDDKLHKDKNGKNAFHYSSVGGNKTVVKVLLDAQIPHNATDGYGNTPLILAAFTKDEAICEELLTQIPDLNVIQQGESGRSALHWAVAGKMLSIVKKLIEKNTNCVNLRDETGDTALTLAAKSDDMETVEILCQAGANVMVGGEFKRNALHWSVQNKNIEMLKYVLAKEGVDSNKQDSYRNTPVTYAAMNASWPELTMLIEQGANVNAQGDLERTALHWVVKNGSKEMTRFLLLKGAELDTRDQYGDTPLSVAVKNIQISLVPDLLEAGCNVHLPDKEDRTPLHVASLYGMTDTVTALLRAKANPGLKDKNKNTPMIYACHKSRTKVVELLLNAKGDINAIGKDQKSALYLAIQNKLAPQAVKLIKLGALLDQDTCVPSPLIEAAKNGLVEVTKALIKAGADVNMKDLHHRTALTWAAQGGHVKISDALLMAGTDPKAMDDSSDTALTVAAFSGRAEVVRRLIPASDINHQEKEEKMSALHLAIAKDHKDCVEALLKAGAEINLKDMRSNTALLTAASLSQGTESLQAILNCGQPFDIDCKGEKGRSVVHWTVGDPPSLAIVLPYAPEINWCDGNGASPLLLAIAHGQPKSAKMLIEAGCDYKQIHEDGRSAIHHAALYGDHATLTLLLEKGLSPNTPTNDSRTPLLLAAIEGHARVVKILLKRHCDVNAIYDDAVTALSVAVDHQHRDVVKQLLTAGADPDLFGSKKLAPLKCCVINNDMVGAFSLLQSGAGRGGGTLDAIQAASIKNHTEMLHLLLGLECDVNGVLQMWKGGTIFYFIEDKDTLDFIAAMMSRPRKLQILCRNAIRCCMSLPLLQEIEKLPIPKKLRDYLQYAEVEKAWFKP